MDDFGTLISNTPAYAHGACRRGFFVFMMCAECNMSEHFHDELLRAYGAIE